jgi:DNA-binding CsgD family transcriptional regulator
MASVGGSEDATLDLIGAIYDVALDATLWPDILNKIGDAVGAPRVMFGFYDGATGRSAIHAPRFDPETVRSCVEWDRDNPLPGLSAGRRPGSVFTISDFIAVEHFKATAFFREWWRPNGLSLEPLTTNLLTDTGSAAIFTCNQDADRAPLDSAKKRLFAALAQHLVRAVTLQCRLQHLTLTSGGALTALDRLEYGFLLVDAAGRPVFVNRAGQKLIDARDGIQLEAGVLSAHNADDNRALRRIIAACFAEDTTAAAIGGEVSLRRGSGRSPLEILAMPIPQDVAISAMPWTAAKRPTAIVLASDPDAEISSRIEAIRERFGLTSAETTFAIEMVRGDGRQAAADRLGITVGTARSHLSRIFDKTGVTRQAELVRLLMKK